MFGTTRQKLNSHLMASVELAIGVLSALGVPMAIILGKLMLAGLLGMIVIGVGLRFARSRKPGVIDQRARPPGG